MPPINISKISSLDTPEKFAAYIKQLGINLNFVPQMPAPEQQALAKPVRCHGRNIGNRWAVLPMEGWDCHADGSPSELTERRWIRFGQSGAKLLYGCEAAAIMPSGKSNTRQMMINDQTVDSIAALRQKVVAAHHQKFGRSDDLFVGLQLTHSGRFSHPTDDKVLESTIAYHNPLLDIKFGNQNTPVVTDEQIAEIIQKFIDGARLSHRAGFDFVDIKHAHGYLGHELLSAVDRPGRYGGSFENRTRFFREIAEGIRKNVPDIAISLRLSLFDYMPYMKGPDGQGIPMQASGSYKYAFGGDGTGLGYDLTETFRFIEMVKQCGVEMICTTVGSPYYNPHIQRPAAFPVCDGYTMPEDPLIGVARQINCVAEVKKRFPEILLVGSGYTYLQEWLPNVGEYVLQHHMADFIGIGRMVLAYPEICADSLAGKPIEHRRICRTIGDCTNAPRNGLISGCYPLDDFYKNMTEALKLKEIKTQLKNKQGK
jgi:2,4-dienoyl-CoA reductase-like NADH-dependent reductase (Old Yellow Enzyme family)